ncbi:hypothetical protein [Polaribacter sp. Hel_I_88]|uniref:hypothetical protein n=1 Tax=Polaribacter sp. Hel_I_88 TaxID=1250006 RepID=UPI00047D9A53|nr:hypothetical protein [Polaribacter sp. Hel_I_88]
MKSSEKIEENIKETFKVLDTIEEVKVNHFFKHKVLQNIKSQQEEKVPVFGWFTPKFQLATLTVILLLNVGSILYAFSSQENNTEVSIESFAEAYNLQSETTSILN